MMRERIDCDPEAHNFLDAIGTVSFKLACGCTIPPGRVDRVTDEDEIHNFKQPGCTIYCNSHGEVVITRATTRLTGWKRGEPALRDFGPSSDRAHAERVAERAARVAKEAAEKAARKQG